MSFRSEQWMKHFVHQLQRRVHLLLLQHLKETCEKHTNCERNVNVDTKLLIITVNSQGQGYNHGSKVGGPRCPRHRSSTLKASRAGGQSHWRVEIFPICCASRCPSASAWAFLSRYVNRQTNRQTDIYTIAIWCNLIWRSNKYSTNPQQTGAM